MSLPEPDGASVRYVIVVDDPTSAAVGDALALQGPRVRVRVNKANVGASASRNRGLGEAAAEWVLFVDDDVELTAACLEAYAARVHAAGRGVCGFVGSSTLPETPRILHEATRMSDITFFYDLPDWMGAPWGVTANLLVRRAGGVRFDERYAKTGGGEDVDFCVRLVAETGLPLGRAAAARVVHEWWPAADAWGWVGYLGRFWSWTQGDGHLMYEHPRFVYLNAPNVVELSLPCAAWWLASLLGAASPSPLPTRMLAMIWLVEVGCETRRALAGPESRHLSRPRRFGAALLSCVVKNVVDAGHLFFHLRRGRIGYACHRFDWFLGGSPGGNDACRAGERKKFMWRGAFWAAGGFVVVALCSPPQA